MRRAFGLFAILASCATFQGADWPTDGGNPQRTNWQKDETQLTKDNVAKLHILWKLKLDNTPRQMHSLFPPLIIGRANTSKNSKTISSSMRFLRAIYCPFLWPLRLCCFITVRAATSLARLP